MHASKQQPFKNLLFAYRGSIAGKTQKQLESSLVSSIMKTSRKIKKKTSLQISSSDSSEAEVVIERLQARTTVRAEAKTNTVVSIPSKFSGEINQRIGY